MTSTAGAPAGPAQHVSTHGTLEAGDIAIVPPGVAHKFTNHGPGRSKLVCIHASPTFLGAWLE